MPTPTDPPPLYGTPRDLSRQTLGRKVSQVLSAIEKAPAMPSQQHVLDVASEIDPATGLYFYRNVVLVDLRQAGKTSISRAKVTHRCLTDPGRPVLYTAQDRNHARRRLEKSFYNPLTKSPFASALGKPRWAAGSEAVRFRNGSEIFIDAATKKDAGHGETLAEAHIDEAFAHQDARVEQSVSPMMVTVRGAQKWVLSAAGDGDSTFLWGKVEAGRARCESGIHGRTAYFEYSAPVDADRDDPATWLACHPAIGYTIDLETLQAEHDEMGEAEFNRAYLGWWPSSKVRPWVIPAASWNDCAIPADQVDWDGEPVWSVDVSPDRDSSAIGFAARTPGARAWLEVVAHEPGTGWVVPHLVKLRESFGGMVVAIDGSGPAGALQPDLEEAGFTVRRLNLREKVDACGALSDDVLAGKVLHGGDTNLDAALASAAKRKSGDAFVWSRGISLDDITPLYVVTLALFVWVELAADDYDIADSYH